MFAAQAQLSAGTAVSCGLWSRGSNWELSSRNQRAFLRYFRNQPGYLSSNAAYGPLRYTGIRRRKQIFSRLGSQLNSDSGPKSTDVGQSSEIQVECFPSSSNEGWLNEVNGTVPSPTKDVTETQKEACLGESQQKDVKRELMMLALPAVGGQAIEPMVQLMETGYIGHLGSIELASAGVSISLFNIISKLFNIPLLSVATSFVAEDISKNAGKVSESGKLDLSSVTTALMLAVGIGIYEAVVLSFGSKHLLSLMGISQASTMHGQAQNFLVLRALGAPAFVLSLALQGIFRGLKDMKTPVFCLGLGNITAMILFPLTTHYFQLGVNGVAISTVVSQYTVAFLMIWRLNKRVVLLPPNPGQLQFGGYLKSGGFLIGRTLSVLLTMTLATSMAARQGPVAMAAHQICLQVWLSVSLLTDALASSAQALIASYASQDDYKTVKDISQYVLKIGIFIGLFLALILGLSFKFLAPLFTSDLEVLAIVGTGAMFVSASQPINSLAFIFDGLHYGISDFRYAAFSMMLVGAISSVFLLFAPKVFGLPGVWFGLTLLMGLRMMAGVIRLLDRRGPWWFLHGDIKKAKAAGKLG